MSQKKQAVYIVAANRSPVAKAKGAFRHTSPDSLLAHLLQQILKALPKLDPHVIDDVIIGCAMPEGEQGMNVARIAALMAGIPESVPAMTVNRFCSSGIQTVALAAEKIALGEADVMFAGGTESMSMVPLGGSRYRANPQWFSNEHLIPISYGMGITAEVVAKQWQIDRAMQDQFAFDSHQRALAAMDNGLFQDEIIPYTVNHDLPDLTLGEIKQYTTQVKDDEGPRRDTNLQALAKLRTVFAAKGTVTAGNASQMSDGAGAVLLMSEKMLRELDIEPIGQFHDYCVAGVAPEVMGIGPIKAIPKVLQQANLSLEDMDWIELNEAFAAQSLAVIKECELDAKRVNPRGGAIALGHPLGATGAIRIATLLHGLRQTKQRYGMVTMCIGTGMGAAGIIEALN